MKKINLKCLFQPAPYPAGASAALLFIRLIVGTAFVFHGWSKIQNPFGWVPPQAPVHIPAFFQLLAAVSEFCGGAAWIMGLLTPVASFGIACTMAVAVRMHMLVLKDPFVNPTGGSSYEPALVYLGIAILILALGPGKFSLDKIIFGKSEKAGNTKK